MTGKCTVCKDETSLACSDCQIDLHTTIFVCNKSSCRNTHEQKCPHQLEARLSAIQTQAQEEPLSTILFTCVHKHQFLDDCPDPECGHPHTRQAIWEVDLQKMDKDQYKNRLVFTCFLENDALPYQIGRDYILTVRERVL